MLCGPRSCWNRNAEYIPLYVLRVDHVLGFDLGGACWWQIVVYGEREAVLFANLGPGGNSGQIWQVTQDLPGDASYRRYTQLQHNEVKFSGIE
jgi:hypothetical protein